MLKHEDSQAASTISSMNYEVLELFELFNKATVLNSHDFEIVENGTRLVLIAALDHSLDPY